MDAVIFVQNIKRLCAQRGVKPTVACRECGVGTSFINNIESRGQVPSVEKVQLLANYLGVTTSELLGEDITPAEQESIQPDLLLKFRRLPKNDQEEVMAIIEMKLNRQQGKT